MKRHEEGRERVGKKNKQPKRLVVWFDHFGFVFFLSFFFPAPPIYMIMSVWLYGPNKYSSSSSLVLFQQTTKL